MQQDTEHRKRPDYLSRRSRRSPFRAIILLLGVSLSIQACGESGREAEQAEMSSEMAASAPAADVEYARQAGETGRLTLQTADTSVAPRVVIRNGEATLEVESLEAAVERLKRLVEGAGGLIVSSHVSSGDDRVRSGQVTARIPAERFDALVSELGSVGDVEEVNVTSDDVTEEFVDASARVANARRLEQRLLDLLRDRTGSLEDVLAVERELMRVREEIDRIEGRLRYLRSRAALSTLSVALHEPQSLFGGAGRPGDLMIDAVRDAWRNFVLFIAGFISMLGILIPLAVLGMIGIWLYRRVRRRGV